MISYIHKLLRYIKNAYLCVYNSNFLILYKGNLDTIILKLLSEHDKMYGYEITKKVKELSQNKIIIKEGALYPALHRLKAKGFLEVETLKVDNRLRKYYKLTQNGNKESIAKTAELKEFINTMQLLLNPKLSFK